MVDSVGKKLSQARLKRGLTIEEAAYATKLRPDKIAALETDDYSSFANNIYARGFLQIYARFLKVDVTEISRTLDNANPISVSDYQYLSNAPTPRRETTQVRREERKPPSLAPLFFFLFLIALGLAGSWAYTNYQRVVGQKAAKSGQMNAPELTPGSATAAPEAETNAPPAPTAATPAPIASQPAPKPDPAPQQQPQPQLQPQAQPKPGTDKLQLSTATPGATPPAPTAQVDPKKPSDQDYVTPTPVASTDPNAHPAPANSVNEVLVATVKKTWVTVRKDDPKAPPIFEDYVYPSANPLKLKGSRFYIEARDPALIQITKNGLPYAYQAADVPVQ